MAKKKLNIAIIGGGFMGRTHSNAFRQAPEFFKLDYEPVLKAVCTRSAEGAAKFAENWGFESSESDWRKVIERKDIDLIDIASPNDTHEEIAIAAARAGKMVMCEKPLGRTAAEAERMVAAVETAKVPNMVWYNYRRVPAVTLAKKLIDEGRLGRSSTTAPSSCRTGPSPPTCRRAAPAPGGWMPAWRAAASPAICWRIASTRLCG